MVATIEYPCTLPCPSTFCSQLTFEACCKNSSSVKRAVKGGNVNVRNNIGRKYEH